MQCSLIWTKIYVLLDIYDIATLAGMMFDVPQIRQMLRCYYLFAQMITFFAVVEIPPPQRLEVKPLPTTQGEERLIVRQERRPL
jgi:hypothetical protein